ncbi:MAG: AEC family transporter [Chromatiales bacterium]|jgi:malonate transporter and related proteins|nr:AEC family transporter [Chromatiales bacterium]
MLDVILLISPVFMLIALGVWARQSGFVTDGFWQPAEKIGYWFLLPSLIIDSLATNRLDGAAAGPFSLAIIITVVGLSAVLFAIRRWLPLPPPSFASVHQGTIRLNGLLAIAVCVALLGTETLPLLAIMVAVWVPFSNGLSVYAYVLFGSERPPSAFRIVLQVIKSPIIFSVFIGLALNWLGAGPFIDRFILFELLGRAALPLGLLAVGAALNMNDLRHLGLPVVGTTIVKLIVMPLMMIGLCEWLDLPPIVAAVAIISACMPSSPSGYMVARNLNGDHVLMAGIITFQTAASLVTATLFATYAMGLLP